jgi:hypothetical protein
MHHSQELPSYYRVAHRGEAGAGMSQKEHETTPEALKSEEATELRRLLQTDEIAPVDRLSFGRRLAEIITRARKISILWQRTRP